MPEAARKFQPGTILSDALLGAFRAKGDHLYRWCRRENILPQNARKAILGAWGGPKGRAILARIIEEAGPETVERLYAERMARETRALQEAAE